MVKLFSDGAIYSQLMQVRDPYLDGHKGEWMTDLDVFQRAFRIYWTQAIKSIFTLMVTLDWIGS